MAAGLGFEPRQTESESAVLPLHNSASVSDLHQQRYLLYLILEKSQPFFYKKIIFSFFDV